jgi:putative phosphoribosyl transferase
VAFQLNRAAIRRMRSPAELAIVEGATHLFDEPGTLEEVARLAREWFARYFADA